MSESMPKIINRLVLAASKSLRERRRREKELFEKGYMPEKYPEGNFHHLNPYMIHIDRLNPGSPDPEDLFQKILAEFELLKGAVMGLRRTSSDGHIVKVPFTLRHFEPALEGFLEKLDYLSSGTPRKVVTTYLIMRGTYFGPRGMKFEILEKIANAHGMKLLTELSKHYPFVARKE